MSENLKKFPDMIANNKELAKEEKPASRELDDDELDAVAGGLVQLINPSSSRL